MLAYLIQPSLPLFRIAIIGEFSWMMPDCEELVVLVKRGEEVPLKFEN